MLFGSDVFVHLLCAIFCAWAGGRNGQYVCHVVSPKEAEPAGKPQDHPSSVFPSCSLAHLFCSRGMDAFYSQCALIFGLISAHTCSAPKIWPLSSPLLTPWFQPSLLSLRIENSSTPSSYYPHDLEIPKLFLHTVARLTLFQRSLTQASSRGAWRIKGVPFFLKQIPPISLSVVFCKGCLSKWLKFGAHEKCKKIWLLIKREISQ